MQNFLKIQFNRETQIYHIVFFKLIGWMKTLFSHSHINTTNRYKKIHQLFNFLIHTFS